MNAQSAERGILMYCLVSKPLTKYGEDEKGRKVLCLPAMIHPPSSRCGEYSPVPCERIENNISKNWWMQTARNNPKRMSVLMRD